MWMYLLIGILVVIAILVIVIATRPGAFRIERSITIAAPPERVFDQVNTMHAWQGWSPWEGIDPNLQRTYSGPPAGSGSVYAWQGNNKVGEGRMTITDSQPPSKVVFNLEFFKPFKANNTATFTFTPADGGTKVVWAMEGNKGFMMKGFSLVMDMDNLVGKDFEKGLQSMKRVAEGTTPVAVQ
jgi:uncharacterized protein YndB with AHSA1/START domain